uniref:alcohol dehydrogenase n=1 Tax=uncultured marine thaumarchaeote KM3_49_A08 TaxID=1456171 RepID=A0A075H7L0_9ARCH|nr:alcohol dehydrogenase, zinc-containing (adh) [uncultured marine thaumarchaeote KM3_49_A08]
MSCFWRVFMSKNKASAIMFNGAKKPLTKKEFLIPKKLGSNEALVKISLTTICGSDVHTWLGHRPFPTPAILGHEIVGKIVKLGKNLKFDFNGKKLHVGDRITWSMTASCQKCFFCKKNLPQKCVALFKYGHVKSLGKFTLTGGFADFIIIRNGSFIFKIPKKISDEEAAPLMCAGATVTSGLTEASFSKCNFVIVQGCGALGLYACAFTKQLGAKKIIAIDMEENRLSLAKQFGADYTINSKLEDNIVEKINKITKGVGADYVIEVTGTPKVIDQGIKFLRLGGKYILLGAIYPGSKFTLDSSDIITKCIQLIGMHNYRPEALDLALKLVLKTKNRYPYKKLVGAQCELSLDGVEKSIKLFESKKTTRPSIKPA